MVRNGSNRVLLPYCKRSLEEGLGLKNKIIIIITLTSMLMRHEAMQAKQGRYGDDKLYTIISTHSPIMYLFHLSEFLFHLRIEQIFNRIW